MHVLYIQYSSFNPTKVHQNVRESGCLHNQAAVFQPPHLTHNTVHESSLHARNLTLESIDLLPAVQWPTVIQLQTASNIRPGLSNAFIKLGQLPPPIKLAPQLVDLCSYGVPRHITLGRLCGGGSRLRRDGCGCWVVVTSCEGDAWCV